VCNVSVERVQVWFEHGLRRGRGAGKGQRLRRRRFALREKANAACTRASSVAVSLAWPAASCTVAELTRSVPLPMNEHVPYQSTLERQERCILHFMLYTYIRCVCVREGKTAPVPHASRSGLSASPVSPVNMKCPSPPPATADTHTLARIFSVSKQLPVATQSGVLVALHIH
jgi:hypothetical protein